METNESQIAKKGGTEMSTSNTTAVSGDSYELPGNSLGLFDTTSSTLANIAPALSVFLTIPFIVANMGAMAPWAFVLAAIAILCTGNALIEFTKRIPSAGGFISYLTNAAETSNKKTGTFVGGVGFYLLLLAYPVSISSLSVFFGSWATSYLGWSTGSWIWIALFSIALTIPFLLKGTGVSVKVAFALFCTEAIILVVLSVIVLFKAHSALGVPFHAINGLGFKGMAGLTFAFAVFGFVGWENSGPLGEESRDPKRTIPRTVIISVLLCMVVFFLAAYALVVGFAGLHGASEGIKAIVASPSPYLELAGNYANWLHFLVFFVGLTSAMGGVVAASLPATRYFFHGARAGLLPKAVSKVSKKTGVPYVAMLTYVGLTAGVTIVLFWALRNPITIAGDESGISTVPLLFIYALTCLFLPVYVWKKDRANFSVLRHVLISIIGAGVGIYGIWQTIKPGQAFPANHYWMFVGLYLVLAVVGSAWAIIARKANHEALAKGLETA